MKPTTSPRCPEHGAADCAYRDEDGVERCAFVSHPARDRVLWRPPPRKAAPPQGSDHSPPAESPPSRPIADARAVLASRKRRRPKRAPKLLLLFDREEES